MKEFFAEVEPFIEGLKPAPPYLQIYARFCASHRRNALVKVFSRTAEALGERLNATIDAYFRAHPMHSVELNENGSAFAEFLDGWIAELADFEWWEWRTYSARLDPPSGAGLVIAPSVEIRRYSRNFCDDAMPEGETFVIFWRDRDLDARREPASAEELHVLQQVHAGETPSPSPTLADLEAAAILLRC